MTPTSEPTFWAELLWIAIGLGLVVYAVTAGADFGAGVWSLFASGPRKRAQRKLAHHAIAPIWEANHVWMIFVVVVTFAAFSRAFAVISVALHIPIALALLGIVLRGAAYAFHAYGLQGEGARETWERVFSWASLITPVLLGTVIAALSSGAISVDDGVVESGFLAGWTTPFAWMVGLFALALFALLAAVYLAGDADDRDLANDFRKRALAMEVIAGALALGTFLLARTAAPPLYDNLAASMWSWSIQGATAVAALTVTTLLWRRRLRIARYAAAAQVGLVVLGWGVAMNEHFVLPDMSIAAAGPHPEVMPALTLALVAGGVVLVPALAVLYRVFKSAQETS